MHHIQTPVILLAFANDAEAPLRELAIEQDDLRKTLDQAHRDGKCQVITLAAATPEKIIGIFQEYRDRICIFHYSGHSDQESLFLRKDFPDQNKTKALHLAQFLGTFNTLELVFINGCFSVGQVEAYHQKDVKAVIATNQAIGDEAAREFARYFYQGLAGGASISESFHTAEASYKTKYGELPRGIGSHEDPYGLPWQIFPNGTYNWRLPLVAKRLTRIPTLNLNKEFVGRETDLGRLKDKMENAYIVVLMNGLGGIGKTALATAYVQQFGEKYDHIAWINHGEDIITSVALNEDLADSLGLPFEKEEELELRFRKILRKMNQLPGHNLMIIDDVNEQIAKREIYDVLPGTPNWRVLLTSRLHLGGFDIFELKSLKPRAARDLFRTYYHESCLEEEMDALLEEVDYHTLTVELLAKLLYKLNNILNVSSLTEILKQKQLDDIDLQEKIWARHSKEERGIYIHLISAFELTNLSNHEIWLLKQFIVLPVERYAVDLLADFFKIIPLELNKTLNSLASKGWLALHEDKTFSIHSLISQVIEYKLQPDFTDITVLVKTLNEKLNVDIYSSPIFNVTWIKYAISVENNLGKEEKIKKISTLGLSELVLLQNKISLVLESMGQYEEAILYQEKTLAIDNPILNALQASKATVYNNIANNYAHLGRYTESLEYHQKALAIRELEPDGQSLLPNSYINIGWVYRALGQYDEALSYLKKALKIRESKLHPTHPHLANSYANIADVYRDLKQYDKALDYDIEALFIRESVLDSQHPDLAASYGNVAEDCRALEQYEKALEYNYKALRIRESVLDVNHPTLATSYNNIALSFDGLKKYSEALRYHQKAMTIYELVLTANHPYRAQSYNNIASTYNKTGQYDLALQYYQKTLAIREAVLKSNHPDLATSYLGIAETYHNLGQYEYAIRYYQKALIIYGEEPEFNHLYVAFSCVQIAHNYRALWQYTEALRYDLKAVAIRESALKANHPFLLISYNNIAVNYIALGQYTEALTYDLKALAIQEALLDANHPNLAKAYDNVAETYRDLGQEDKVLEYEAKAMAIRKKRKF